MTEQSPTVDRSEVPAEIDRWNWGAFLLNWIWGVGNNSYIALLTLVPFFGILIMPFVLGAKGSRWAWRNGRWDSIAHFKRVQRAWAKWACVIYLCIIAFFGLIFGGVVHLLRHSAAYELAESQLRSSPEAASVLGTPITLGFPLGAITTKGATGRAVLNFAVSGPKGAGHLSVEAIKKDGLWSLRTLKLSVGGRDSPIDLLKQDRADADQHRTRRIVFAGELRKRRDRLNRARMVFQTRACFEPPLEKGRSPCAVGGKAGGDQNDFRRSAALTPSLTLPLSGGGMKAGDDGFRPQSLRC